MAEINSGYDTLTLASSETEGDVYTTQTGRENHFWVCGSTGQGKSKFLEYLICKDIDRLQSELGLPKEEQEACPLLFIDPTPNGEVLKKVLAYCEEIKFNKVILIDPLQSKLKKKVPPINLFNFPDFYASEGIGYLLDAFQVLYQVKDQAQTAIVRRFLRALFSVIFYADLTANELQYFILPLDKDNEESAADAVSRELVYALARKNIKSQSAHIQRIVNRQIAQLEISYKNLVSFRGELGSTARRLAEAVEDQDLSPIFGHRTGLKFTDVIGDRWVVLVNVSSLDEMSSRLLATVILNQYIFAVERLRGNGFDIPVYIYLDEASRYATDKLIEVLDLRRNSKIRMVLSHQYPDQLKNRGILGSVKANCLTKIAFHLADEDDRISMLRTMYGGDLDIKQVSYALSSQPKQKAVFKIDKKPPVVARVPDKPNSPGNAEKLIAKIFNNGCYYTYEQIEEDYADRFKGLQVTDIKSSEPAKKTERKTTRKAAVSKRIPGRPKEDLPPDNEAGRTDEKRKPLDI